MENKKELEIVGNIGINCNRKNLLQIHPNEMHMIYSIGSLLVVRSVDGSKDRYLDGHQSEICCITISKQGNRIASGEA